MSQRKGEAFEPRNSDRLWKDSLEITPEYFKKRKM
jgi:hypothetical protein